MDERLRKEILDFNYMPLVNDLYESLNDESYSEIYENIKQNHENTKEEALLKVENVRNKVLLVMSMVVSFINNLLVRICGYMVVAVVIGFIHNFTSPNSFLKITHMGQNIYDYLFKSLFSVSSKEILIMGSEGMQKNGASPMSENASYLLFYSLVIVFVLLLIWLCIFIIKMSKKEKKLDIECKTFDMENSLRLLGCNQYDDLHFIKEQFKKKYLKNRIHVQKQKDYIEMYKTIVQNKDFSFEMDLDEKNKKKVLIQVVKKAIVYSLNLISKGVFVALLFVIIYYRFVDFFITKGYLVEVWKFFEDIHNIVHGGILSFTSFYNEVSTSIQVILSVSFLICMLIVFIQGYTLVYKQLKRVKVCYVNYLSNKEKGNQVAKFQDPYNRYWLILMIFVVLFWVIVMLLQK